MMFPRRASSERPRADGEGRRLIIRLLAYGRERLIAALTPMFSPGFLSIWAVKRLYGAEASKYASMVIIGTKQGRK